MDLHRARRAPRGVQPKAGTKFRFIGKPFPGWDGIVRCEVLAVDEPVLLRYDWRNKETDEPAVVTDISANLSLTVSGPDQGRQAADAPPEPEAVTKFMRWHSQAPRVAVSVTCDSPAAFAPLV